MKTEFSRAAANAPWINHTWATSWPLNAMLRWALLMPTVAYESPLRYYRIVDFWLSVPAHWWGLAGIWRGTNSIIFHLFHCACGQFQEQFVPTCMLHFLCSIFGRFLDRFQFTMPVSVTCKVLLKDESRSKLHVNRFFVSEWQLLTWRCVLMCFASFAKGGERIDWRKALWKVLYIARPRFLQRRKPKLIF